MIEIHVQFVHRQEDMYMAMLRVFGIGRARPHVVVPLMLFSAVK